MPPLLASFLPSHHWRPAALEIALPPRETCSTLPNPAGISAPWISPQQNSACYRGFHFSKSLVSPLSSTCSQGRQETECSRTPAKAPTSTSFQPDCPENSQVPGWPAILPTSNLPKIVTMPKFLQLEERGYSATQRKIKTVDKGMKRLKSLNGTAIF